jgi:predicted membrane channel-forming protein YqfA (hemolysin III family)
MPLFVSHRHGRYSRALLLVVLVVNSSVQDGTSNWLKGLMLLVAYATLSVSIYYHTFENDNESVPAPAR